MVPQQLLHPFLGWEESPRSKSLQEGSGEQGLSCESVTQLKGLCFPQRAGEKLRHP